MFSCVLRIHSHSYGQNLFLKPSIGLTIIATSFLVFLSVFSKSVF